MPRIKDYRVEVPHNQTFIYVTTAVSMKEAIINVQNYLEDPKTIQVVVDKTERLDSDANEHNMDADEWDVTALN